MLKDSSDVSALSPELQRTRTHLLDGALRVFARDGLQRVTTRVIAEEIGVSELTLYRHFRNKEGIISAVFDRLKETSAYDDLIEDEVWTEDPRESLKRFARSFYDMIAKDEAFIRTLVGEARRHPEPYRKIIMDSFRLLHDRLVSNLQVSVTNGRFRRDVNLSAAVDMFLNMLLAGMLKRSEGCYEGYTATEYVDTCVELFVAGLERRPRA